MANTVHDTMASTIIKTDVTQRKIINYTDFICQSQLHTQLRSIAPIRNHHMACQEGLRHECGTTLHDLIFSVVIILILIICRCHKVSIWKRCCEEWIDTPDTAINQKLLGASVNGQDLRLLMDSDIFIALNYGCLSVTVVFRGCFFAVNYVGT